MDETDVEVVHTFNPSTQTVEDYKYPRPGSKNAPSKLRLLQFTIDEDRKVSSFVTRTPSHALLFAICRQIYTCTVYYAPCTMYCVSSDVLTVSFKEVLFTRLQISSSRKSLPRIFSDYFPDCNEYLVRAGWTPDGAFVWFQLLDRVQKRLKIVFIQWEAFVDETDKFPREQVRGRGGANVDY